MKYLRMISHIIILMSLIGIHQSLNLYEQAIVIQGILFLSNDITNNYTITINLTQITIIVKSPKNVSFDKQKQQSDVQILSRKYTIPHNLKIQFVWSTKQYRYAQQEDSQNIQNRIIIRRNSQVGLIWSFKIVMPSGKIIQSCYNQYQYHFLIIVFTLICILLMTGISLTKQQTKVINRVTPLISIIINSQNALFILWSISTFYFYLFKKLLSQNQTCGVSLSQSSTFMLIALLTIVLFIMINQMVNLGKILIRKTHSFHCVLPIQRIVIYLTLVLFGILNFCLNSGFFQKGILYYVFWTSIGTLGPYFMRIKNFLSSSCLSKYQQQQFFKTSQITADINKVTLSIKYTIQSHAYLICLLLMNRFYPVLNFQQTNLWMIIIVLSELAIMNILVGILIYCEKKKSKKDEVSIDQSVTMPTNIGLNNEYSLKTITQDNYSVE